jgi:hypothetical protein
MTRSFLCYRLLRVTRHPRCSGEDLPQSVHLPRDHHRLRQDSSRLQARLLASAPIVVSRSAWRPSSPTDGSGLLAATAAVGISTWRAGVAAAVGIRPLDRLRWGYRRFDRWLSHHPLYVYLTTSHFLYVHFAFLTRPFTRLSGWLGITTRRWVRIWLPSSAWQEDPTATTLCHSSYFAFACCSFSFGFACREL